MTRQNQLSPNIEPHITLPEQPISHEIDDHAVAIAGINRALGQDVEAPHPYREFINPYERIEYMHLTDNLIATLDGSIEHGSGEPYDTVIYLDSSARPVDWMVRGLWDFAAKKDADGKPVPRPEVLFCNIDARRTGFEITPEDTASLADTYPTLRASDPSVKKRVLIVDEIAVSGETLDTAGDRFRAAFPDVEFDTYAWLDEQGSNDLDNVRWYERDSDRLRLVIDPATMTQEQRQQLKERGIEPSSRWLAIANPDTKGAHNLRTEIDQMVAEVKSGRLPYWPSFKRTEADSRERTSVHNDNLSEKQFADFRIWMKYYYAPTSLATHLHAGPLSEREVKGYLNLHGNKKLRKPELDEPTTAFARKFGFMR